jgi:hypothetical protein
VRDEMNSITAKRQLAERRSSVLMRLRLAVDTFAKAEHGYRKTLAGAPNASIDLKRAYATMTRLGSELSESIEAAKGYSQDENSWRLRDAADLDRPVCGCGCGVSLTLKSSGRVRIYASASCRMRALRRRRSGLPEATPRLKPGGRAKLLTRLGRRDYWLPGGGMSRLQADVLNPFWRWWMGDPSDHKQPPIPFSLDNLTMRHKALLAAEDPVELKIFLAVTAGRSQLSARTHLLYMRRTHGTVDVDSRCGRRWLASSVAMSADINTVDCVHCRGVLMRIARGVDLDQLS